MDPQVDRALADARARGIDVREEIGSTGYCVSYAVGDALVMRIPRSEFPVELGRGDGPIVDGRGIDSAVLARTLLASSTDRVRQVDRGPLARFVDQLDLDGGPVALHERARGRAPARADIPVVASAVAELHEVLGYHGHLVPQHIFVDGDDVTFTDVLPVYPKLLGGVGFALPIHAQELAPRDEGMVLRDVAALIALGALTAGCDLGWDVSFVRYLEEVGNRGPMNADLALAEFHRRTSDIEDAALRGWIDAAGRLAIDHYLPVPSVRPDTRGPRAAAPGIARSLLTRFHFHAALGAIAQRLVASPSLFDFVAAERAIAIDAYERPDVVQAFEAGERTFAAIVAALPELQAFYGDPPADELGPIAHPPEVFEETYALRTLLLDVDRLLAPIPETFEQAGGLLARARASVAALAEKPVRYAACRRYVNFVSR